MAGNLQHQPSQPRPAHHPWFRRALVATLLLALAIAGIFYLLQNSKRDRLHFKLDDDVSLQLVAILHHGQPEYEPNPLLKKYYVRVPASIRKYTDRWWRPEMGIVKTDITDSGIALVFKSKIRPTKSTAGSYNSPYGQAVNSSYTTDVGLRLRYDEKSYTGIESVVSPMHSPGSSRIPSGKYLVSGFKPVPVTQKEITIEVMKRNGSGTYEVAKSATVRNPAYRELKPIGASANLPATITHDGVSVTLETLVSNTVSGFLKDKSRPADEPYVDLETLRFPRHDGKIINPPYTAAVLRVNNAGSTTSPWQVSDIAFSYGDANVTYPQQLYNPLNREVDRGLVQVFTFSNDVRAINQPVKARVQLRRHRDFRPEDLATVKMTLPTTGTFSPHVQIEYHRSGDGHGGDGQSLPYTERGYIIVSNQCPRAFTMGRSQEGLLTVTNTSPNQLSQIQKVELIRFDGSRLDLAPYRWVSGLFSQKGINVYNIHRGDGTAATSPIDSAEFDQVEVTVAISRVFPKDFEFIATPVDAQLPVIPGVF